jgi:hypothetical protein
MSQFILTRLLAVVAQTLTAGAHLGVVTDVAALVAGAARKGRHPVISFENLGSASVRTLHHAGVIHCDFFCGDGIRVVVTGEELFKRR